MQLLQPAKFFAGAGGHTEPATFADKYGSPHSSQPVIQPAVFEVKRQAAISASISGALTMLASGEAVRPPRRAKMVVRDYDTDGAECAVSNGERYL